MASLTCTITKAGRSDAYGRPLIQGQTYTSGFDEIKSLVQAGFASVSNPIVLDDGFFEVKGKASRFLNKTTVSVIDPDTGDINALVGPSGEAVVISSKGEGLTLGIVGDSLTARNFAACGLVIANCSQTGGVGTIRRDSLVTNAPIGTVFRMHGWDDPKWNGEFIVTGHTASDTYTFNIDPTASPSPVQGIVAPQATFLHAMSDTSWLGWAQAISGIDIALVTFNGRGSLTSTDILVDFDEKVVSGSQRVVILETPSNDAKNGLSAATTIGNMTDMVERCLAAGITPILCATAPYGATFYTAPRLTVQLTVNSALAKYAKSKGIIFWDWYRTLVDANSTTGYFKTNYSNDDIHLAPGAAIALGAELSEILKRLGFADKIRTADTVNELNNQFTNSALSGTTGTLSGGATGQVADGCTVQAATATVACSKGTNGVFGSSQIIAVSGATGTATMTLGQAAASNLGAGKSGYMSVRCKIVASGPFRIQFGTDLNSNAGHAQMLRAVYSWNGTYRIPAGTYDFTFKTPVFKYPDGSVFTTSTPRLIVVTSALNDTLTAEVFEPLWIVE